jgi:hypothetical protein
VTAQHGHEIQSWLRHAGASRRMDFNSTANTGRSASRTIPPGEDRGSLYSFGACARLDIIFSRSGSARRMPGYFSTNHQGALGSAYRRPTWEQMLKRARTAIRIESAMPFLVGSPRRHRFPLARQQAPEIAQHVIIVGIPWLQLDFPVTRRRRRRSGKARRYSCGHSWGRALVIVLEAARRIEQRVVALCRCRPCSGLPCHRRRTLWASKRRRFTPRAFRSARWRRPAASRSRLRAALLGGLDRLSGDAARLRRAR